MKNISAKETLKNHYRKMAEEQAREYHLTHNYYNGKPFTTPYERQENTINNDTEIAKKDQEYLNALLYPQPTLGNAFAESLSALSLVAPTFSEPVVNERVKASENLIHRMTDWYDLYLAQGLTALLPQQSARLSTANLAIIKQAYMDKTILVQNICILAEFWIRSPLTWHCNGNTSLLEHLFVRYEKPDFLPKHWLKTATPANLQWLFVYIAYTQGGSLKQLAKHFSWQVVNQKIWHQLAQCNTQPNAKKAVLYTEVMRLGGCEAHYDLLVNNEAYCIDLLNPANPKDVDFWYSMVNWLTLHQDRLFGVQASHILKWARHQYTEFSKEDKCFSMIGRSFEKVLRDSVEYHASQVERRIKMARQAETRRLSAIERATEEQGRLGRIAARQATSYPYKNVSYHWKSYGWEWGLTHKNKRWTFIELTSTQSLFDEGEAMEHCVASYSEHCNLQESAIISLRLNKKRCLTIEIQPASRALVQVSGFANRSATQNEMAIIRQWLGKVVE
ncbi:MAG: PcfJ domain-containing protein [Cocleimonas sp.]|nr:PcfJ domain-containing protein [Cocleimonas sp.]